MHTIDLDYTDGAINDAVSELRMGQDDLREYLDKMDIEIEGNLHMNAIVRLKENYKALPETFRWPATLRDFINDEHLNKGYCYLKWSSDDGKSVIYTEVEHALENWDDSRPQDGQKACVIAMKRVVLILSKIGLPGSSATSAFKRYLIFFGFEKVLHPSLVYIRPRKEPIQFGFRHSLFQKSNDMDVRLMRSVSTALSASKDFLLYDKDKPGHFLCGESECINKCASVGGGVSREAVSKKNNYYSRCPTHINECPSVQNEYFSPARQDDAEASIQKRIKEGKQIKANKEAIEKRKMEYYTADEIFNRSDFNEFWNVYYDTHYLLSKDEMDEKIASMTGGLKMANFMPSSKLYLARGGMINVLGFFQERCYDCSELSPALKYEYDDNGMPTKIVVNEDVCSKDFYGEHHDHYKPVPEQDGYIKPAQLRDYDKDVARRQLLCTRLACNGCHFIGDESQWKKTCTDENMDYETTVWTEPGDPRKIPSILDSKQFIKIKEEFEKYGVGYSGGTPLLTSDEMRCLFAECTNGKDLRDCASFIGKNNDYWNKRMPEHTGLNNNVRGFSIRNEILVNYVKKESRTCMGNERNDWTCPCARDIINTVPRRLSLFHFDHRINKSEKKGKKSEIGQMIHNQKWSKIEVELRKKIEGVKCAYCRGGD